MEVDQFNKKPKWFKPVQFPEFYKKITANFRQFFKQQYMIDLVFHCENSESIGAHQMILLQASPIFQRIFLEFGGADCFNQDNIIHVSMPEISKEVMSDFLESLYLGAVPTDLNVFEEFRNLSETFMLFSEYERPDSPEVKLRTVIVNPRFSDKITSIETEEETNLKTESEKPTEDPTINFVKAIDEKEGKIEVFIVEENLDGETEEDIELLALKPKDTKNLQNSKFNVQNLQKKRCTMCNESGISHRILINSEEDKRRLGIPIVPSNESLKFLYRCCASGCPFQTIRYLRNAAAFHNHIQKHENNSSADSGGISSTSSSKKCPLCFKPRIVHRNQQVWNDKEGEDGSTKLKGCVYKCCKCSASKLSAKKFFEHTHNHISKKFACETCNKGFSQQRFLDQHFFVEHGKGKGQRFHCQYENCNFEAKYTQTLASHIKEVHEGEKRSHRSEDSKSDVVCNACGKTLKKWYYQMHHKSSCSSNVVYKCDICGQDGFVNNTTLNNHVKAKHSDDKPYVCEHCPARYATSMSLSTHRSRVHRVNKAGEAIPPKLFPCGLCGKILTGKQKRDNHIKTVHEGAKDFECAYCAKRFTTQSNLKIHLAALHNSGDLPHKCNLCHKGFTRKKGLEKHMEKCEEEGSKSGHHGASEANSKTQGIVIVPNPSPYHFMIGPD